MGIEGQASNVEKQTHNIPQQLNTRKETLSLPPSHVMLWYLLASSSRSVISAIAASRSHRRRNAQSLLALAAAAALSFVNLLLLGKGTGRSRAPVEPEAVDVDPDPDPDLSIAWRLSPITPAPAPPLCSADLTGFGVGAFSDERTENPRYRAWTRVTAS